MTPARRKSIDAANRYHSFMRGWNDGAKFSALNPAFMIHADLEIVAAYTAGYADGRLARHGASTVAQARYSHVPSVLRELEEMP